MHQDNSTDSESDFGHSSLSANSNLTESEGSKNDIPNYGSKKTPPPIIRLIEMEGLQGAVGVICQKNSPTTDDVYGIKFMKNDAEQSLKVVVTESKNKLDGFLADAEPKTDVSDLESTTVTPKKSSKENLDESVTFFGDFFKETEKCNVSSDDDSSELGFSVGIKTEKKSVQKLSGDFNCRLKVTEVVYVETHAKKQGCPHNNSDHSSKRRSRKRNKR